MVKFMPLNLLNDFTHLGRFDLVLCRNVLIYFDQATKSTCSNASPVSPNVTASWCWAAPRRWLA